MALLALAVVLKVTKGLVDLFEARVSALLAPGVEELNAAHFFTFLLNRCKLTIGDT